MACKNCVNSVSNKGKCLEVQGFDGHYTWGTPLHDDDEYPSYVFDSAQTPELDANNNPNCFAYKEINFNEK